MGRCVCVCLCPEFSDTCPRPPPPPWWHLIKLFSSLAPAPTRLVSPSVTDVPQRWRGGGGGGARLSIFSTLSCSPYAPT